MNNKNKRANLTNLFVTIFSIIFTIIFAAILYICVFPKLDDYFVINGQTNFIQVLISKIIFIITPPICIILLTSMGIKQFKYKDFDLKKDGQKCKATVISCCQGRNTSLFYLNFYFTPLHSSKTYSGSVNARNPEYIQEIYPAGAEIDILYNPDYPEQWVLDLPADLERNYQEWKKNKEIYREKTKNRTIYVDKPRKG